MLRFMNTPGKIPPFHEQPQGDHGPNDDSGRGFPRSVMRSDSAPSQVDRLSALVHDLDNLLDGSLRCVSLAARTMNGTVGNMGLVEIEAVRRQLETASKALERMAGMVHAAMQGRAIPIGSVLDGATPSVTLAEAIEHAAEVMRHSASSQGCTIDVRIESSIGAQPAGPIYSAILNAIKNALESIEAAGGTGTILIDCHAELDDKAPGRAGVQWACIEVVDDGAGIPKGVPTSRLFAAGYSTKAEGRGIGLALSRSLLESMGGHAELCPRDDRSDRRRPGAIMTFRFPINRSETTKKRKRA